MDNVASNLVVKPRAFRHHARRMPRRVKELLKQAESWCDQERGRRSELARYLGIPLSAVSAWFREYRKPRPAKQPTGEQVLAIQEFLQDKRDK